MILYTFGAQTDVPRSLAVAFCERHGMEDVVESLTHYVAQYQRSYLEAQRLLVPPQMYPPNPAAAPSPFPAGFYPAPAASSSTSHPHPS